MNTSTYNTISVIFAILSLCLSIFTNCRVNHQLVEEKQIDAMIELVEYIQNNQLCIYTTTDPLVNPMQDDSVKFATIFELTDIQYRKELDSFNLYFATGQNTPLNFNRFIFNPIIPIEVRHVLENYIVRDSEYYHELIPAIDHFILIENINEYDTLGVPHLTTTDEVSTRHEFFNIKGKNTPRFYTLKTPAFSNFGSFKRSNKKLFDVICSWFSKHNIDNIKLLSDTEGK